jgi:hypothetical protein
LGPPTPLNLNMLMAKVNQTTPALAHHNIYQNNVLLVQTTFFHFVFIILEYSSQNL